jgi:Transposase DNA-binding/Transposase DDE domain
MISMRKHRETQMVERRESSEEYADGWVEDEVLGCQFEDVRHCKRLRQVLGQFSRRVGAATPWASQDWAGVKAAYRFLSNRRVSETAILAGHFLATRSRVPKDSSPILVLHDTTEFSYRRTRIESVGLLRTTPCWPGKGKKGMPCLHTVCGILMHSSLAVTTEGLPLGLVAVKYWTRRKFQHTRSLRGKICPTRIPIENKESIRWIENLRRATAMLAEPRRCVHIGDRESDIWEMFCVAQQEGTHFLVRTCVDRRAEDGSTTVERIMNRVPIRAVHRIEARDAEGDLRPAIMELRYQKMSVCPPIGKEKRYPKLTLTVLHAQERNPPAGRRPIVWKLLTDLQVVSRRQAIEKLEWYAQRWKIESFHKILKSGCRAEESRLRTADRLVNLIAILSILSWRIFWITMLNRTRPDAEPSEAFTELDQYLLDELVPDKPNQIRKAPLTHYIIKLARLGGYLARTHDPPPGNTVVWRGLSRLTDIELGIIIGVELVGN